jgi:hypothetical protein
MQARIETGKRRAYFRVGAIGNDNDLDVGMCLGQRTRNGMAQIVQAAICWDDDSD